MSPSLRLCCALAAALALIILLSSSQRACAATATVNSLGDAPDAAPGDAVCATASGVCTLRAALEEANRFGALNTINFSVTGTINLTGPLPSITVGLTINGPGSSLLTVRRDTGGDYRIFTVAVSGVSISGLTITNGKTADGGPATSPYFGTDGGSGGGLWNSGGGLTLSDVVVTGNRTGNGGAINGDFGGWGGYGGGIYSSGMLTMTRVVVSNNTTGNGGLGGYGGPGGPGGGIYVGGSLLTMTNVIVSGNTTGNAGVGTNGAMGGGGGAGAGIYVGAGALNLSNVTITSNTAGDGDDGGHGGGIYTYTGTTTTLTDCTISNNSSGQGGSKFVSAGGWGGGINNNGWMTLIRCTVSGNVTKGHLPTGGGAGTDGIGGGIFTGNLLTLIDSTISGNHADPDRGRGGGIYNGGNALTLTNVTVTGNTASGLNGYQNAQGVHSSGTANVSNTIIAGNGSGGTPDVTGIFTSHGHNLIGAATLGSGNGSSDESGFTNGGNGDQVGTLASPIDARLAPLADNGGPTKTHALLVGSPALDAGDNALANDANDNTLTIDQRGTGRIAGATTTIDIGAFEFHPSLDDVTDKATNEDTPLTVSFNIGDGAGSGASVTASSDNQSLVPDANLTVTGSSAIRVLQVVPAANLFGTAHITLNVTDSHGAMASDSFLLTVVSVNDAPTFTKGTDQTVNEDSGAQTVAGWATNLSAGPSDESAQSLSFLVTNNTNPGMFSVAPSISPSGALTYTPAPDANGSAVITVVLKDNGGTANVGQDTSAAQTFKINVTPVNDPPVAVNDSYTTNEDTKLTIFTPGVFTNDTDADHDPLTAELVSGTSNGVLTLNANGSFTYTPNANFNGADSFTYRVSDGQVWSNVATVSLTINAVNDAPINIVPAAPQRVGNTPLVFSTANGNAISVTDVDAGDNPVRVTLSVVNGTLTLKTTSGLSFNGGDGTDDPAMTFTGTLTNINAALDGLSFTPIANFSGRVSLQITTNDLGNTGGSAMGDSDFVTIIIRPGGVLQFSATGYQFSEGDGRAAVIVTRFGDTTGGVSVNVTTIDDPAAVPCDPTAKKPDGSDYPQGIAYARCDYATTQRTVTFAPGDVQPKTVFIPIINDSHVELSETFQVALSKVAGAFLGSPATATVTIQDNDVLGEPNPILSSDFYIRQQYLDFLSREPEVGQPWTSILSNCPDPFNSDPNSPSAQCDRLAMSYNFLGSAEFQATGFFAFRFYKVSFGRLPLYSEIVADMRSLSSGSQSVQRAAFTNGWAQRQDFKNAYDAMSNQQFVDTLMGGYKLQTINTPDPSNPDADARIALTSADLVARLNGQQLPAMTRAQVVRAIADSNEVGGTEFNSGFVAMQYFGYLRRDPDPGYDNWLTYLNAHPGDFRTMVFGFVNSPEYKSRFGKP